ncbi:MAG: hypothetical protein IJK65_04690 [Clostridiales bacterium]|nr:hypothetical protein [Clostridiales bacterium]
MKQRYHGKQGIASVLQLFMLRKKEPYRVDSLQHDRIVLEDEGWGIIGMKKFISALLCLSMISALTSCSGKETTSLSNGSTEIPTEVTTSSEEVTELSSEEESISPSVSPEELYFAKEPIPEDLPVYEEQYQFVNQGAFFANEEYIYSTEYDYDRQINQVIKINLLSGEIVDKHKVDRRWRITHIPYEDGILVYTDDESSSMKDPYDRTTVAYMDPDTCKITELFTITRELSVDNASYELIAVEGDLFYFHCSKRKNIGYDCCKCYDKDGALVCQTPYSYFDILGGEGPLWFVSNGTIYAITQKINNETQTPFGEECGLSVYENDGHKTLSLSRQETITLSPEQKCFVSNTGDEVYLIDGEGYWELNPQTYTWECVLLWKDYSWSLTDGYLTEYGAEVFENAKKVLLYAYNVETDNGEILDEEYKWFEIRDT